MTSITYLVKFYLCTEYFIKVSSTLSSSSRSLLVRPFGCNVFSRLCQHISLAWGISFFCSIVMLRRLICSMIVIVTSLPKSWYLLLWRKCSDSWQLLTPLLIWFLWLLRCRLKAVSLFPTYCNLTPNYINHKGWLTIHCMESQPPCHSAECP